MLKINQIKLIFLIFFFSPLTKSETLILRADSWCPFSCNPKFSQVGYMVDIAREIFKKKNIQIDYQLMNWDIAKLELREGKIQGIVGASKGDGDLIFPIHALGKYQNFLYFLPTLSTKIQKKLENLSTLKDLKIGVVKDYSYGVQADQLIKDRPELFIKVSGAEPLEVLLKMLDEGKISALYECPQVFTYKLKMLKKNYGDYRRGISFDNHEEPLFIAFAKNDIKTKKYSDILDEGILEMRKSGRLMRLLDNYSLIDWE